MWITFNFTSLTVKKNLLKMCLCLWKKKRVNIDHLKRTTCDQTVTFNSRVIDKSTHLRCTCPSTIISISQFKSRLSALCFRIPFLLWPFKCNIVLRIELTTVWSCYRVGYCLFQVLVSLWPHVAIVCERRLLSSVPFNWPTCAHYIYSTFSMHE